MGRPSQCNFFQADNVQLYDIYWGYNKPDTKTSSLLIEQLRKFHLKMFASMDGLNKSYSLGNLMLTLRERLAFAFHLYFWITRNHLFDLILASVNFLKVGMIFYCFQKLKNEVSWTLYSQDRLLGV